MNNQHLRIKHLKLYYKKLKMVGYLMEIIKNKKNSKI